MYDYIDNNIENNNSSNFYRNHNTSQRENMTTICEEFKDLWFDFKNDMKDIWGEITEFIEREICRKYCCTAPPWDYHRTTNEILDEEYVHDIEDFQDFDTPLDNMP